MSKGVPVSEIEDVKSDKPRGIADYIDLEKLQEIQDTCAKALGIALVTSDYRGVPVTHMSGFTRHCALGRTISEFIPQCERCDAFGGIRSATDNKPCIYRCHAGLVDFAVPLVVEGNYLGAVLGGQVKLVDADEHQIEDVLSDAKVTFTSTELLRARDEIKKVSYDQLEAAAQTVRTLISTVVGNDLNVHDRLDQSIKEKDQELVLLRANVGELQREKRKQNDESRRLSEVFKCFFPVTNELHVLASNEQAHETDALLLDFVDVSRYIMETTTSIVTLGEEVTHINTLLRLLSMRYPGRITYSVKVPERLYGIACPFMVLRPVILAALKDPWGAAPENPCNVHVAVIEADEHIKVCVTLSTLTPQDMKTAIESHGEGLGFSLRDANRHLCALEENNAGFTVESSAEEGCVVSFMLPLTAKE